MASPSAQVLGSLLSIDDTSGAEMTAPSHESAPLPLRHDRGPSLRVITIQMHPESLGAVQVVLRKTDAAISIRLEAERTETATSLESDRPLLAERITEAGYALEELVVTQAGFLPEAEAAKAGAEPQQQTGGAGGSFGSGFQGTPRKTSRTTALSTPDAGDCGETPLAPAHSSAGGLVVLDELGRPYCRVV